MSLSSYFVLVNNLKTVINPYSQLRLKSVQGWNVTLLLLLLLLRSKCLWNDGLCNCVVNFLLEENYLLTAFELLHELLDDQAIRLKNFFSQFPPDQISRFNTLRVADPQTLLQEKEAVEEKLAITEYELRLAQEDISKFKTELQKQAESPVTELRQTLIKEN